MQRSGFRFFFPFRVRYSEIDGQRVVFNAHYLTYYDVTITEYFRALGFDQYEDAKQTGEDFHVVKSTVEYKAPILFDQEIEVGCRVGKLGNSSMTFELAIYLKGGDQALATGEVIWVNTNQATHRPARVPDHIRKLISDREGREVS
ncbi:acyl-CoA thioester hydrolase YbgC [Variibacter gotjawalensis]|uniref:Acyl-CoA thioester hydrolase YbgC n=1 Tax=Variibacter gotjawalensis TaxID=1333996 RepID=A0A0S3PTZ2_9BRAD|nr:thioesterase family protein [Variibacter gotjawalensis]NIK49680.1 acyl-CoA thioester hydrolase [Variibacter gotjawalensis]RZS45692.1 (3S)-malyl-CoA thioesterase [Variibacter gotjawalensis]BAT59363.1 acyl-CoA thioester hydrolase YbgC [Variibacter gotjawalensis]